LEEGTGYLTNHFNWDWYGVGTIKTNGVVYLLFSGTPHLSLSVDGISSDLLLDVDAVMDEDTVTYNSVAPLSLYPLQGHGSCPHLTAH
jgi:hypothetical protein